MGRRICALLFALVAALSPAAARAQSVPDLAPYRGLGTWVDIFDHRIAANPKASLQAMAVNGVRTLYLETSNASQRSDIAQSRAAAGFLDAAHQLGIKVVAWYLPSLTNLNRDLRRSLAAIRFQTLGGQRFDSFGLDIESSAVRSPSRRSARLLALSRRIRANVGPGYALGAIIPAPRGMQLSPRYWPGFPYAGLRRSFDVFLPMGYFTYRVKTAAGTYDYTARNIQIVREQTGDPSVPVHAIGGIANRTGPKRDAAFVQAAKDGGAIGASLYDFATTGPDDWPVMAGAPF